MRALLLLTSLTVIALSVIDTQAGTKGKRRLWKGEHADAAAARNSRFSKLERIVKCCGLKSCSNVKYKQKFRNESLNASTRATGNFKTNRETSTANFVNHEKQKLSSPKKYENTVTNMEQIAMDDESSANSMDGKAINVDVYISKIETTRVSDQAVTFAETFPTNGPVAEKVTNVPSLISSTSEMATFTTNVVNTKTTHMATKEDFVETSILLKSNPPITTMSQLSASKGTDINDVSTTNKPSSASTVATGNYVSTTSTPSSTSKQTTVTTHSTTSISVTTTTTKTSMKASSTSSSIKTSQPTRTGTTQTTTGTKGYTTATTKAAQVFPSCPSLCKKDVTLFDITDGSLDDPGSHGFWETSSCGKLYVFGKSLANWEQNMVMCCRLGMTPITIADATQSVCFNNLINGQKWKYNSRYWTSGLRSSQTAFKWCSSNTSVAPAIWLDKEPSNTNGTENCAQIVISKANSTAQLDDINCGIPAAFACQGPTTPPPKCEAPVCPNITCVKNNNLYTTLADGVSSYLTNPTQHGYMVELNGRSFLFSYKNDTRTFEQSLLACCSLGMKLLSLQQDEKYIAIIEANNIAKQRPDRFWTSGTDFGCEGYFGFCTTNRLLRDESRWETGQKDNLNLNEHCLAVNIDQSALLRDENCDLKMRYICEASLASGTKAVEIECRTAFNLTADAIQELLSRVPEVLEEKCFLKCYGEGTNMFLNGKLAEDKIYAQFASVSAGDVNKLMEMYSTMSHCAKSAKGMDACDKASQLLKCGTQNSPNLLNGMMKNLETSITEAPVVLPPSKAMCPPFNCVIDDDLKVRFDTAGNKSVLEDSSFKGIVSHACNQKYFHVRLSSRVPMQTALEFCCKFGLRMVTVDTASKVQCLKDVRFDGVSAPYNCFMVAASRLGNFQNPIWCFSDTPFYPLPGSDFVTQSTGSNDYRIMLNPYLSEFYVYPDSNAVFICETI